MFLYHSAPLIQFYLTIFLFSVLLYIRINNKSRLKVIGKLSHLVNEVYKFPSWCVGFLHKNHKSVERIKEKKAENEIREKTLSLIFL